MTEFMEKLLNVPKRGVCKKCKGSGMIIVDNEYISWTPVVCWCGKCNGSGWADLEKP